MVLSNLQSDWLHVHASLDHVWQVIERNKRDNDSSVRTEGHGDWRVLCWIRHLVYILQYDVERLHVSSQLACLFEPLKIVTLRLLLHSQEFTAMHTLVIEHAIVPRPTSH